MMYTDDISGKVGVKRQKKDTWRAKERGGRGEGDKKISNDVSASGQLPRLLIKSADGRGGEGDRGA